MERKILSINIRARTEIDIFTEDVELVRKWYGSSKNTTGTLNIEHGLDVANILKHCFNSEVIDSVHFKTLYRAALGHDLFEDTKVDRNEVEKNWGKETVMLIDALTNVKGDKNTSEYAENLSKAEEDVRLVKLADILSNINNSLREFGIQKREFLEGFWIPLLDQYNDKLLPVPWKKYKNIASSLTQEIQKKIILLKKYMSSVNA
jgi:(p)ppGpp synthase/HD superfamily hydrolase